MQLLFIPRTLKTFYMTDHKILSRNVRLDQGHATNSSQFFSSRSLAAYSKKSASVVPGTRPHPLSSGGVL
jgi:hypothetical protein